MFHYWEQEVMEPLSQCAFATTVSKPK